MELLFAALILAQPPAAAAPSAERVEDGLRVEVRRAGRLACGPRYAKLGEVRREVLVAALVDAEDKAILNTEARRCGALELAAAYFFMRGDLLKVEISVVDTTDQPGGAPPITRDQIMQVVQEATQGDAAALRRCQVSLSGDPVDGFDLVIARRELARPARPGRTSTGQGR